MAARRGEIGIAAAFPFFRRFAVMTLPEMSDHRSTNRSSCDRPVSLARITARWMCAGATSMTRLADCGHRVFDHGRGLAKCVRRGLHGLTALSGLEALRQRLERLFFFSASGLDDLQGLRQQFGGLLQNLAAFAVHAALA